MIPQPHLSVQVVNFAAEAPDGWQRLLDHAVAADRAGVDRVAVSDHVVFGDDLSDYAEPAKGGLAGGRQPTGPDGHWLEPLTTLAWLAGRTDRVRLQTGILLAALRRPVVLAKSAATLDVLSGGRLDLGVGVAGRRSSTRPLAWSSPTAVASWTMPSKSARCCGAEPGCPTRARN